MERQMGFAVVDGLTKLPVAWLPTAREAAKTWLSLGEVRHLRIIVPALKPVSMLEDEAAQASRELSSLGAADMASGCGLFAAIGVGNKATRAAQASR